jgi:hypothetical protein
MKIARIFSMDRRTRLDDQPVWTPIANIDLSNYFKLLKKVLTP